MITLSHANHLLVTTQCYEIMITSEHFRNQIHFEFDKCIVCDVFVYIL